MYKSLTSLENKMREILIDFKDSNIYPDTKNKDIAYAFYLCCERNYIANVYVAQNCNGDYLFQMSGNDHITDKGLEFIHNTSRHVKILHSVFNVLKGTFGFLLGIIATVISAYIVWYFQWL